MSAELSLNLADIVQHLPRSRWRPRTNPGTVRGAAAMPPRSLRSDIGAPSSGYLEAVGEPAAAPASQRVRAESRPGVRPRRHLGVKAAFTHCTPLGRTLYHLGGQHPSCGEATRSNRALRPWTVRHHFGVPARVCLIGRPTKLRGRRPEVKGGGRSDLWLDMGVHGPDFGENWCFRRASGGEVDFGTAGLAELGQTDSGTQNYSAPPEARRMS